MATPISIKVNLSPNNIDAVVCTYTWAPQRVHVHRCQNVYTDVQRCLRTWLFRVQVSSTGVDILSTVDIVNIGQQIQPLIGCKAVFVTGAMA